MSLEDATAEFLQHRSRLLGIAYRMLGSMWDAEDVVAEALVRWLRTDRSQVAEPAAFLTTVASRLALDQLRSARAKRESYVGTWLPEPTLTEPSPLGPLETVEQRESVSLAVLRMLERLTPNERAVFVLREAFDLPYAQIAEILDVTPEHARQLFHRSQSRVVDGRKRFSIDPAEHSAVLKQFVVALGAADMERLHDLLTADVIAYNDGGGKARAAPHPITGSTRVARFFRAVLRRFQLSKDVRMVEVNGQPAALLRLGDQEQLIALNVQNGRIREIYDILNPDKLRYVRRQLAQSPGSTPPP
jgi:RNA polymerase sigma-70 factor, ECF subfamily